MTGAQETAPGETSGAEQSSGPEPSEAPPPAPVYPASAAPIAPPPQAYELAPPHSGHRYKARDTSGAPVLTLGLGLGFGFLLDSSDQTQFIKDWQESQADVVIQIQGFSDILLYFLPRLSLSYSPFRWGRLQGIFEYGWGPKYISMSGGSSRLFHYNRASAGLLASLEVPFQRHRLKALDIGAGPLFHYVTFEGEGASTVGAKVQASTFVRVGQRSHMEVYLAYDYVPASSGAMELDYSSISLGFVFHVALLRRD